MEIPGGLGPGEGSGIAKCRVGAQSRRVLRESDMPWFAEASKRRRYLVGVSGGADSVALIHLLVEKGFRNLVICHLDHRLRGRQSTSDARWVGRLAASLSLPMELGRVNVAGRMRTGGGSLETAAREARHGFFRDCARRHRCARVLLAHHADDQAETVLWNLLRGSRGLRGMLAEQTLDVGGTRLELLRPLLACRHADLVAWLRERGLSWREDASNAEPIAVRNRLRNEVMPLLTEISGRDPVRALLHAAEDTRELESLETEWIAAARIKDPQGRLHLKALAGLPVSPRRAALRGYLMDHGVGSPGRVLMDRCLALMDPKLRQW